MAELPLTFVPNLAAVRAAIQQLQQEAANLTFGAKPMGTGGPAPTFGTPGMGGPSPTVMPSMSAGPGIGGAENSSRRLEQSMDRMARAMESVAGRLERTAGGGGSGGGRRSPGAVVGGGSVEESAEVAGIPIERARGAGGRFTSEVLFPTTNVRGAGGRFAGQGLPPGEFPGGVQGAPFANPRTGLWQFPRPGASVQEAQQGPPSGGPQFNSVAEVIASRQAAAIAAGNKPDINPLPPVAIRPGAGGPGRASWDDPAWLQSQINNLSPYASNPAVAAALGNFQARLQGMGGAPPGAPAGGFNPWTTAVPTGGGGANPWATAGPTALGGYGNTGGGLTPAGWPNVPPGINQYGGAPGTYGPPAPNQGSLLARAIAGFTVPPRFGPGAGAQPGDPRFWGSVLSRQIGLPGQEGPMPMGLYFMATFGMMEVSHAMTSRNIAESAAAIAETPIERLEARLQGIRSATAGPFGSLANEALEAGNAAADSWFGKLLYSGQLIGPFKRGPGPAFTTRSTLEADLMTEQLKIKQQSRVQATLEGIYRMDQSTATIGLRGMAADFAQFGLRQQDEYTKQYNLLRPSLDYSESVTVQASARRALNQFQGAQGRAAAAYTADKLADLAFEQTWAGAETRVTQAGASGNFGQMERQLASIDISKRAAVAARARPEMAKFFFAQANAQQQVLAAQDRAALADTQYTTAAMNASLAGQHEQAQMMMLGLQQEQAVRAAHTPAQAMAAIQQFGVQGALVLQRNERDTRQTQQQTQAMQLQINRQPLDAAIENMWADATRAIQNAPNDVGKEAERAKAQVQERLIRQQYKDQDEAIQLNQTTNRQIIRAEADRNRAGAQAISTAGGYKARALQFQQQGDTGFALEELSQGQGALENQRRDYLEQFRATNVNLARVAVNNPRDQENPAAVMDSIDAEVKALRIIVESLLDGG